MPDTRSRLRTERRAMFSSAVPLLIIGFVLGYVAGFAGRALSPEGFGPWWAWSLICFGLGGVAALVIQRLLRPAGHETGTTA